MRSGVCILLLSAVANAASIDISTYLGNFGFEAVSPPLATCTGGAGYTVQCNATVLDWTSVGVNGTFQPSTIVVPGFVPPTLAAYNAAQGMNAAFVTNYLAFADYGPHSAYPNYTGPDWGTNPTYISQQVTVPLAPNTDYKFSAAVISKRLPDPDSQDYAAHFRIMIFTDTGYGWAIGGDTTGFVPQKWYTETLAFTTPGVSQSDLGSNFTVYLINDGASNPSLAPGEYSQVEYDAVPEPAGFLLIGSGLLVIARIMRHHHHLGRTGA